MPRQGQENFRIAGPFLIKHVLWQSVRNAIKTLPKGAHSLTVCMDVPDLYADYGQMFVKVENTMVPIQFQPLQSIPKDGQRYFCLGFGLGNQE